MTREEQETIIIFNEADKTAEVFTYNGKLTRQLEALTAERGEEVAKVSDNKAGAATYTIPKAWVKIRPKRILSEEQREKLQMQGRRLQQNRILAQNL